MLPSATGRAPTRSSRMPDTGQVITWQARKIEIARTIWVWVLPNSVITAGDKSAKLPFTTMREPRPTPTLDPNTTRQPAPFRLTFEFVACSFKLTPLSGMHERASVRLSIAAVRLAPPGRLGL